jgi:hypothetical protein
VEAAAAAETAATSKTTPTVETASVAAAMAAALGDGRDGLIQHHEPGDNEAHTFLRHGILRKI